MTGNEKGTLALGIDTSNYKTSVAVVHRDGRILANEGKLLAVKPGMRGLRQSEALFQHVAALPELIGNALRGLPEDELAAVAFSQKPRPLEDSYMPCFRAGELAAFSMAAVRRIPCLGFSHQEGHIEAARRETVLETADRFLCWHLSGGTCELLQITGKEIRIIGGSKDISFGQLIDRVGVALGMRFPAGPEMDRLAQTGEGFLLEERSSQKAPDRLLPRIRTDGTEFNLSGVENQAKARLDNPVLAADLFYAIGDVLARCTRTAVERTGISGVLFMGGVASGRILRRLLEKEAGRPERSGERIFPAGAVSPGGTAGPAFTAVFGAPELSSDNAAGIAQLGGKAVWRSDR